MINKINSYNYGSNIAFCSNLYKPQSVRRINILNLRRSEQKVNTIKKICEEIFSTIQIDNSIIKKVNSSLKSIKIADSSILFLDGLEKSIRYSKEKSNGKDLFIMEILNRNLPEISIAIDPFGSLIKSHDTQNINYFDSNEINRELLEESFDKFYNTTDEPLFNLRMFIKRNGMVQENNTAENIKINVPKVENYVTTKKTSNNLTFLEQKADLIKKLPIAGIQHNYSYKEVIEQNDKQEKDLIEKGLLQPKKTKEDTFVD